MAIVEGNSIFDVHTGIVVPDGASPTINGNQLEGLNAGIRVVGADIEPVIEPVMRYGLDLVVPEGSALSLDASSEICQDGAPE